MRFTRANIQKLANWFNCALDCHQRLCPGRNCQERTPNQAEFERNLANFQHYHFRASAGETSTYEKYLAKSNSWASQPIVIIRLIMGQQWGEKKKLTESSVFANCIYTNISSNLYVTILNLLVGMAPTGADMFF